MFKFIKQYAEKMENVQAYPMISLIIFFLFFVILLVYVKKMDKKSIRTLSDLPLNDERDQITQ
jgi:cytochrome c oxidase cbb3-type subunit IV